MLRQGRFDSDSIKMNAKEFKLVLEELASSGATGFTVDDLLERLEEREKIEDSRTISPKRAVFPMLYSA